MCCRPAKERAAGCLLLAYAALELLAGERKRKRGRERKKERERERKGGSKQAREGGGERAIEGGE